MTLLQLLMDFFKCIDLKGRVTDKKREREGEISHVLVHQWPKMGEAEASQELLPVSLMGTEAQEVRPCLQLCQAHLWGAGSEAG